MQEPHPVCEVLVTGRDVREDGTSGDPDQGGLWGRVELQAGERQPQSIRPVNWFVSWSKSLSWSYLGPLLPWKKQVGSTLVPVCSSSGSVPQELDLDLTGQTGLKTQLLNFKIKQKKLKHLSHNLEKYRWRKDYIQWWVINNCKCKSALILYIYLFYCGLFKL